ncbi:hypothetical protein L227DRAFT_575378 [Lentinus tigrinus ALCF2SS1-6]|uniref:Uncharacterized protein n=1 Tax=Lentinus tigrinus ALCF2SS1-6 TaxID=1328759 RepID=A0A5C2S916_9APHY|nr:hypothetical protein L227DRAFT_575378 [Lentinus tigrinus ALCF2SS1-6]
MPGGRRLNRKAPPNPEPEPRQLRFCQAVKGTNDPSISSMCAIRLPQDGSGPRFCRRHSKEFAKSFERYKEASLRAQALQSRVLAFSRMHMTNEFDCRKKVVEAIMVTDEFIRWASRELEERKAHAARFYGYDHEPDPGHLMRMNNVAQIIQAARFVGLDLEMAYPYAGPQQEPFVLHGLSVNVVRHERPETHDEIEEIVQVPYEDTDGPGQVEDFEEPDECALEKTMDVEEMFADKRAELEALEMLSWYSLTKRIRAFFTSRRRVRDDGYCHEVYG